MSKATTPQAGPHSDGIKEGHAAPPFYFKLLYGGLVVWAVFFTAYFLLSGWSSSDEFARKMAVHQETVGNR